MEKIIKALLEAKYPTVNVASLLEIVNATPNPSLATEILCGLYEEAMPCEYSSTQYDDKRVCKFVKYDKWQDRVTYSYMKEKILSMYVPKELDTSVITLENYKDYKVAWINQDETKSFYLPTGEMVEETSTTSLERWGEDPDKHALAQ